MMNSLYPVASLPATEEFLLPSALVVRIGGDTLILGHHTRLTSAQIAAIAPSVAGQVQGVNNWGKPADMEGKAWARQVALMLYEGTRHHNAYLRMNQDGVHGRLNNQLLNGRVWLMLPLPMAKTFDFQIRKHKDD